MEKIKKTEFEVVEKFLLKEGFTEITEEEKKSSEFKESLINIRNLNKTNKHLQYKKVK